MVEYAPNTIIYDDKIVIDDILLYSNLFQHFFTTFLVLLKFLQSSGCLLTISSVTFSNHVSNFLATILLRVVNVQPNQSLI